MGLTHFFSVGDPRVSYTCPQDASEHWSSQCIAPIQTEYQIPFQSLSLFGKPAVIDLILAADKLDTGTGFLDTDLALFGIEVCSQDCNQLFVDFLGNSSVLSTGFSGTGNDFLVDTDLVSEFVTLSETFFCHAGFLRGDFFIAVLHSVEVWLSLGELYLFLTFHCDVKSLSKGMLRVI